MVALAAPFITWLMQIGASPTDSDDLKLQKSLLVVCAFPFMAAGFGWGIVYWALGAFAAGWIPLSYGVISALSFFHFNKTGSYKLFRFSQLFFIMILPFCLMVALGGFISGSAVILWAVISPMGALLFDTPKNAPRWFAVFVGLLIVSGIIDPYLAPLHPISDLAVTSLFVLNLASVGFIIFLMVFYFVSQKNIYQEKSESLLLNIFPKEIVKLLKDDRRTIADDYDSVSVMFADVVDFTPLSATMTPTALVEMLNEVFSFMDELADKYGLEKIKTIGDCYMVASGVPTANERHAHNLANMALDLREYVSNHRFAGQRLSFRIGINSGPVVAGVIGRKKFIYDLWGDAVNTASRMESHGTRDTIQISESTYNLIKDEFECTRQGVLDVKGKGAMQVFSIESLKNG